MNEQVDNIAYEFLWKLLANPADSNHSYIVNLRTLTTDFPHSGILQALLTPNGDKQNLKHAAAYFNPVTLHKLATMPNSLPFVTDEQVVQVDEPAARTIARGQSVQNNEPETIYTAFTEDEKPTDNYPVHDDTVNAVDKADESDNAHETDYSIPQNISSEPQAAPLMDELTPEMPLVAENDYAKELDEYIEHKNDAHPSEPDDSVRYFHQDIDDEIYDEIVSIEDISLEQLAILDKEAVKKDETTTANETGNNYFVFEPDTEEINNKAGENAEPVAQEKAALKEKVTNNLSRYNDEKMPYTFMWWLDKTRKEHAEIYQPYISNSTPVVTKPQNKEVADELQQQYYENLVSISSINELDKVAPKAASTQPARKEDKIIERFIQDVPQIKHPSGIKLDNENKAKKSSEDKDELVTETLAHIYTEQMLYHKAILTYKKLMLKFPEKSLYFAGQIEQLENKIN